MDLRPSTGSFVKAGFATQFEFGQKNVKKIQYNPKLELPYLQ